MTPAGPQTPGPLRQVVLVIEKDLLIEWRARARAFALASFAVTVLLLFSFAVGPNTEVLRAHAGAYLWLAVLLSSTLLLGQSFQFEVEAGALEGLILAPVEPSALFFGKALSNTLQLVALAAVITIPMLALFDAAFAESWAWYLVVVVLGEVKAVTEEVAERLSEDASRPTRRKIQDLSSALTGQRLLVGGDGGHHQAAPTSGGS